MDTKPAKLANRPSWPTKAAKPQAFSPRPWKTFKLMQKGRSLRGRTNVAKVGPPWAGVKSAKVAPTSYVHDPRVAFFY